ncbi:MAG: prepilin peptidase [Candidatus Nealsonbacteria bacterium]
MFNLLYSIFIFIFGLIVGSFLNCVIYRLEQGISFLRGRSFCPKCNHSLNWTDLVPILSYIFLGGKCRYCKEKISPQYPIVELITGTLFLSVFLMSGSVFEILFNSIIVSLLIIIFIFDLKHYIIPDRIVYLAILVSLVWLIYIKADILTTIYALLSSFGFFLLIALVSKGKWMGVGDVKLAFFMGLFLGWPNVLVALFLAFLLGSIVGVFLMLNRKKSFSSEIPFGPFLVSGTLMAFFEAENLINWYLTLFLIQ